MPRKGALWVDWRIPEASGRRPSGWGHRRHLRPLLPTSPYGGQGVPVRVEWGVHARGGVLRWRPKVRR